jgi:biopolymer transport protein ExbB
VFQRPSKIWRIGLIALPLLLLPLVGWGQQETTTPRRERTVAQEGLITGSQDTFLALYIKGGPTMHLITLCSILALAITLERFVSLRKGKIISSRFLEEIRRHWYRREVREAMRVCKEHDIALARILRAGLLRFDQGPREIEHGIQDAGRREATLLRKNLGVLSFLAQMAPLLGLFGTVLGMTRSFDAIAKFGQQGNIELVASGIAEALTTTVWGLMVGIPALGFYYYFRRKIELRVLEMEGICVSFLEDLDIHQGMEERKVPPAAGEPAMAPARFKSGPQRREKAGGSWDGAPSSRIVP